MRKKTLFLLSQVEFINASGILYLAHFYQFKWILALISIIMKLKRLECDF